MKSNGCKFLVVLMVLLLGGALGCSPSEEATAVDHAVLVDGAGLAAVTSDLGYTVTLTEARAVLTNVQFTRAQDVVAGAGWTPLALFIGTAHAHPGHGEGGAVIGEMPGEFVLDWTQDGAELGTATLIGAADTLRFTFAPRADSVHVVGVASKDGVDHAFAADFDLTDVAVEGVPFLPEALNAETWGLRLTAADPFEGDTLFDGIEFATADWTVGAEAYNRLGRALRTHDHYLVSGVTQ